MPRSTKLHLIYSTAVAWVWIVSWPVGSCRYQTLGLRSDFPLPSLSVQSRGAKLSCLLRVPQFSLSCKLMFGTAYYLCNVIRISRLSLECKLRSNLCRFSARPLSFRFSLASSRLPEIIKGWGSLQAYALCKTCSSLRNGLKT